MAIHSGILALGNLMDRGAWRATVHGVAKSQTRLKQLNTHTTHTFSLSSPLSVLSSSISDVIPHKEPTVLSWSIFILPITGY